MRKSDIVNKIKHITMLYKEFGISEYYTPQLKSDNTYATYSKEKLEGILDDYKKTFVREATNTLFNDTASENIPESIISIYTDFKAQQDSEDQEHKQDREDRIQEVARTIKALWGNDMEVTYEYDTFVTWITPEPPSVKGDYVFKFKCKNYHWMKEGAIIHFFAEMPSTTDVVISNGTFQYDNYAVIFIKRYSDIMSSEIKFATITALITDFYDSVHKYFTHREEMVDDITARIEGMMMDYVDSMLDAGDYMC